MSAVRKDERAGTILSGEEKALGGVDLITV